MRYITFSYRFAEEVLNSKLALKQEIHNILVALNPDLSSLTRPQFNRLLRREFVANGWQDQPLVFNEPSDPAARMDFLKDRVGIEVGFGHSSFIGIDLLKFQVCSYSGLDKIDVGVYIVTTRNFQKLIKRDYGISWGASLTFEKIVKYLPHFKSAVQVPVYVIGMEM